MARPLFLRWCLLLVLVGGLLLLGGGSAAASAAEPYGELGHFGSAGTGHGQFQIPPETHNYAFGADPTDNSVYVGDEPTPGSGEYRVQKLGSKGEFIASVSFKPANPIALEGIAVDPAKERLYVLAVALRGNGAIDPGTRAAGTLYAFKTKAPGEKLEPAVSGAGAEAKEGVLANPKTLETESETQGHALLDEQLRQLIQIRAALAPLTADAPLAY